MLRRSERATLNFYQWEYPYRGYHLFDTPVDIEVPYRPFHHLPQEQHSDDGRAPSLIERVGKLLISDGDKKETEEPKESITPHRPPLNVSLVGCRISFPQGYEIDPKRNLAYIQTLVYSYHHLSFEIIGNHKEIWIQFVVSEEDESRIRSQLSAYFPSIQIQNIDVEDIGFSEEHDIAIADFGLNKVFVLPVYTTESFGIDPLTSVIAHLEELKVHDIAMVQILFKGVTSPISQNILCAVGDRQGGSFFRDAPEILKGAQEKTGHPLFSVVVRIATQGGNEERSRFLASELARTIVSVSRSQYNNLIPLSNEGYDYYEHYWNLLHRQSNRLGCVLNTHELSTLVHYPNKSIVSSKLNGVLRKTKCAPHISYHQRYVLGVNEHHNQGVPVGLSDEDKLRHTHIIGATGVGKSTLMVQMMLSDIEHGNGCALFDSHGDMVDDIVARIPEHRINDVIIIDPSDIDFPVGFNLLGATSEAEKMVLSSDLVSAFKQTSTSWGDNMTAVLSNAINTFLESSHTGTLIELKRFLVEDSYRNTFLKSVDDPSIQYYWKHEYYMVKKRIAPLLTRIDTFLRPKVIRYMMAQNTGVDFKTCIEEKKIVLIKLSLGLIGEDNSYLLGSLFLSKFNQVALGRQSLSKSQRHPYYLYLDECHNFITPSIVSMLSGARKYGLGLILAHQDLGQIQQTKVLNSIISNPQVRICFRLGDNDAQKLASGFSYFDSGDLQNLGVGKAIVRIGSRNNDFNISTKPLTEVNTDISQKRMHAIREQTRIQYSRPRLEIENILSDLLPQQRSVKKVTKDTPQVVDSEIPKEDTIQTTGFEIQQSVMPSDKKTKEKSSFEQQKQAFLKQHDEQESLRKHDVLQQYVRNMAQSRGYKVELEKELDDGSRIDVLLSNEQHRIAVEISVSNTIDYEVHNIKKCIDEDIEHIVMISESALHLSNIQKRASQKLSASDMKKIHFIDPSQFGDYLNSRNAKPTNIIKRIRGYKVRSTRIDIRDDEAQQKKQSLEDILLNNISKQQKK